MAKPKAPAWLREAFRDGVDERQPPGGIRLRPAYVGAYPGCWLAHHDPRRRPCQGPLERFHFINRQRIEDVIWARLYDARYTESGALLVKQRRDELMLIAAWDPRNGGLGCEGHHRRVDSHATPPLVIASPDLPSHVHEFAAYYGVEGSLEDRFPPRLT